MNNKLTPKEIIYSININKHDKNTKLGHIYQLNNKFHAIGKAINIEEPGYNVYVIDSYSQNRIDEIKNLVLELFHTKKPPKDICLTILDNVNRPLAFKLENGMGNEFKECINNLKKSYYNCVLDFYESSDAISEKDILLQEIEAKREKCIEELIKLADKQGFKVKSSGEGFSFIPYVDDKEMTEDEYDSLDSEKKLQITDGVKKLKTKVDLVLNDLHEIQASYDLKLKELFTEYMYNEIEEKKEKAIVKFIECENIPDYIETLCQKIEKELIDIVTSDFDNDVEKEVINLLGKFAVSVLVDNQNIAFPQVIYEKEPSIANLFGSIEYETDNGTYITNLSSVYPGSVLKANEGCVIIRINDLIENPLSYTILKKSLLKKSVSIEGNKSYLDVLALSGLKIENIPISTKVILIGDLKNYELLYNLDEDFRYLFKLKDEYVSEVNITQDVADYLVNYIFNKLEKYNMNIENDALTEMFKYLSRLANSKKKINIDTEEIDKIIILSVKEAELNKRKKIIYNDVLESIYDDEMYYEKLNDYYNDNKIILSLNQRQIGSINALAVVNFGYLACGRVIRITGVCNKGDGKIIDTQNESSMSGKVHQKSLSILSGLLKNAIDPYKKIPIDVHLSFEQVYAEVDGDSASVAEMICILSAISKIPIKGWIAVTGSLNQFGEVQPIGGINEKIEGFFYTCKNQKINNVPSVIVPDLNKDEIILKKEIEDSISRGKFNIYTMKSIEDAIEVLMIDKIMSINDFWNIISKEIKKYY